MIATSQPADRMPEAPSCAHHLVRTHRRPLQKLVFSEVFRCTKCGADVKRLHPILDLELSFVFSRYTRCIRCCTPRVQRLKKRDPIDSVSMHITSQLLRLTGAPLNKCPACRLQYYDWRPPQPDVRQG